MIEVKRKCHLQTAVIACAAIGLWIMTFSFFSFWSLQVQVFSKGMPVLVALQFLLYTLIPALGALIIF